MTYQTKGSGNDLHWSWAIKWCVVCRKFKLWLLFTITMHWPFLLSLPWNTTVPGLSLLLFDYLLVSALFQNLLSLVGIPTCDTKTCSTSLLWSPKSLVMISTLGLGAEICFPSSIYVPSVVFFLFFPPHHHPTSAPFQFWIFWLANFIYLCYTLTFAIFYVVYVEINFRSLFLLLPLMKRKCFMKRRTK